MSVTIDDVQRAVGSLQLCAGHPAGVEAAIHAMRTFLESGDNDGILLIDADNAFNRINRQTALWNTQFTCPAMKYALINMYRAPSRIFMNGKNSTHFELASEEGTTQGCPLGMAMYALALAPLVKHLQPFCNQVWYADDATGCDKFKKLREWFDELVKVGPKYGYYPKPSKCILLSKPERAEEARRLFKGTDVDVLINGCKDSGVELNCEGTRHLGAAVGTEDFKTRFVKTKVTNWVQAVEKLAVVAQSQPHAAFASFTHCLQSQWTFLARSMPRTSPLFQPLEDAIRKVLIPALLRRDVTDLERDILGLPARFGGLGLYKPTEECQLAHDNSLLISLPLVRLISRQEAELDPKAIMDDQSHSSAN